MNFDLTDDQRQIQDLAARFAADRFPADTRPHWQVPAEGFDASNWALLAETGLLAVPFAETDGGLGGGAVELIALAEAFGRGLVAEPYLPAIVLGAGVLAAAGSAAQRAEWLPKVIAGEATLAFAFAEPGGRFAIDAPKATASGEAISGEKTFVLGGPAVDAVIVTTRDGVFLTRGGARRAYRVIDGSPAFELSLDGTAAEPLPGGMAAVAQAVDRARLWACAEMLGVMGLLFDTTVQYLKDRKQFGQPIGSFQALQHRAADLYASLELARSQVYRAAMADEATAIAAAKAYVSRAAIRLGEECIQMHGGMGITDELIVGHGHRRLLLLANLFGDADFETRRYLAAA